MATTPILLNKNIHGFLVSERIGQGGMGEVYKATHLKSKRVVAIKVLMHLKGVDRFRNEARLQANVNHPNIVKLFDIFDIDGRPALIMEYIEGDDLDVYLKTHPTLSLIEKLKLFEGITSAISHLHDLSITHRDIKPANIKVLKNGQIKLMDFGIAKGYSSPTVTISGQTIGTLDYMSPERLNGKFTTQSDVWSLGVLLYEMMLGQLPFKKGNEIQVRKSIMKGEYTRIDKMSSLDELSKKAGQIIHHCLQVQTSKRYANAGQIHHHLKRLLKNGSGMSMTHLLPNFKSYRVAQLKPIIIGVLICSVLFLAFQLNTCNSALDHDLEKYSTPVTLTILTNSSSDAYIILPNGKKCDAPCAITRNKGAEIPIQISADGYITQFANIQFRKDDRKTYALRRK